MEIRNATYSPIIERHRRRVGAANDLDRPVGFDVIDLEAGVAGALHDLTASGHGFGGDGLHHGLFGSDRLPLFVLVSETHVLGAGANNKEAKENNNGTIHDVPFSG
jgi:hypothetical protein